MRNTNYFKIPSSVPLGGTPSPRGRRGTVVLAFGTFDIFHKGHESFLRQAKRFGKKLIVVAARDKTVEEVKGRLPKNTELARLEKIKKSGLADLVILGNLRNKYTVIEKIKPDVICLGYDQKAFVDKLDGFLFEKGMKNVKIKRLKSYKPEIFKSSKLT